MAHQLIGMAIALKYLMQLFGILDNTNVEEMEQMLFPNHYGLLCTVRPVYPHQIVEVPKTLTLK